MAIETLFNQAVVLTSTADLVVQVGAKHSYANTSGAKPWKLSILFDGVLVNFATGGGAPTDAPSVFVSMTGVSAGAHTVTVTWYGHSSMSISGINMFVLGKYK